MAKLSRAEFLLKFNEAINNDYIKPYYQIQINHQTKRIIGAEALMRFIDPISGIQYPSDFIPLFEEKDLITKADLHIFEDVCKFISERKKENKVIVPISINLSIIDILKEDIVESLEKIRKEYNVDTKYLKIEITESKAYNNLHTILDVINKLHNLNYIVEMDDFGSGFSSLNSLKDLDVDVIKLDMKFLDGNNNGRDSIIISSIVNMAKWLNTPVIVEGVETKNQADFMQSIGCNLVQGYLYSKPVDKLEFIKLLEKNEYEEIKKIDVDFDVSALFSPNSESTLIFNNLYGPACILLYDLKNVKIIKLNQKYVNELGVNVTFEEIMNNDPFNNHDEEGKKSYIKALNEAIIHNESEVTTLRKLYSKCCGENLEYIKSNIQLIGKSDNDYLFIVRISNITNDINKYLELQDSEKKFRMASEAINFYAWEYDVLKKEMRPCVRCMRDLGLPKVIKNYPEPVIESGLFPKDYGDLYRNMHKLIEQGEKVVEEVIPLTENRIPFIVRYVTEFDELNRPIKAYGSAELVK